MTELRYERPPSLEAAVALMNDAAGRAVVLAGGTDLQIKLRDHDLVASLIVDIKALPGIQEIHWAPSGELTLGAAVTMRQLYEDARIVTSYPALARGAEAVGSLQVRTRATLGGNLCNASPCMDTAPGLIVLGAKLRLVSAQGTRDVPAEGFFKHVKKTLREPQEICTAIVIPAAAQKLKTAFGKIKRVRGHDLALVNAAVAYDPEAGTLRAAIGSAAPTPVVTPVLSGVNPKNAVEFGQKLAALALDVVKPIDDVRASAEYRRDMAGLLCRRLVSELLGGQK